MTPAWLVPTTILLFLIALLAGVRVWIEVSPVLEGLP